MSKDIFISYSRKDQEFVTRLASDLDAHVAGVWLDQSAIRAGQKWHDEIIEGIRDCKALVLVLSPDSVASPYVREELDKALELAKPILPVIYRPATWTDEFAALIKDIQTIDLRSGSYTDNFQKLVDGLRELHAVKAPGGEQPFLREPTSTSLQLVFRKALSWGFAWSLGWLSFWSLTFIFLFLFIALQNKAGWEDIVNFLTISFSGWIGGFIGGLISGVLSMLVLRPYVPSIFWKHISPTIRIWALSGPLGMVISGVITVMMVIIGVLGIQNANPTCQGQGITQCLNQIFRSAYRENASTILLVILVFSIFVIIVWFLTGMLAGWLVVRHVRKLEPGITRRQGWSVAASWGCGAILAALITALTIGVITASFGL
jgi:hypothetical protein